MHTLTHCVIECHKHQHGVGASGPASGGGPGRVGRVGRDRALGHRDSQAHRAEDRRQDQADLLLRVAQCVQRGLDGRHVRRISSVAVALSVPQLLAYDIAAPETIDVLIPASALLSGQPLPAVPAIRIVAANGTLTLGGTLLESETEATVQTGGGTTPTSVPRLRLDLADDTWLDGLGGTLVVHGAGAGANASVEAGPAEAAAYALIRGLQSQQAEAKGWTITQVWNTHWHPDHAGGNLAIKEATGCVIIGPVGEHEKIPGLDRAVGQDAMQQRVDRRPRLRIVIRGIGWVDRIAVRPLVNAVPPGEEGIQRWVGVDIDASTAARYAAHCSFCRQRR